MLYQNVMFVIGKVLQFLTKQFVLVSVRIYELPEERLNASFSLRICVKEKSRYSGKILKHSL